MNNISSITLTRISELKNDPSVIGIILTGSKSRSQADALSDDDLEVIITNEAYDQRSLSDFGEVYIEETVGQHSQIVYDIHYKTLSHIEARVKSPLDIDHWPYEQVKILFDRYDTIRPAVDSIKSMDKVFRHSRLLYATLDTWSAWRRTEKMLRRESSKATIRLLIVRGVRALSKIAFALEWRWLPPEYWLLAELSTLEDKEQVGRNLIQAMVNDDHKPLLEALNRLEDALFAEGVPRPQERSKLFFELNHQEHAIDRVIHSSF